MKLGMMLEVDETFTTIWLSGSSEVRVKVRRWPQSPIETIFMLYSLRQCLVWKVFQSLLCLKIVKKTRCHSASYWNLAVCHWLGNIIF